MMKCDLCGEPVPATMQTKHVTGVIEDRINGHIHVCDRCFDENDIRPIQFHFSDKKQRWVATQHLKEEDVFKQEYMGFFKLKEDS